MSEQIAEVQPGKPLQPVTKDIIAELQSVSRYGMTSGTKFTHPYLLILQHLTKMRAAKPDDDELQFRVQRPLFNNIVREMLANEVMVDVVTLGKDMFVTPLLAYIYYDALVTGCDEDKALLHASLRERVTLIAKTLLSDEHDDFWIKLTLQSVAAEEFGVTDLKLV